MQLNLLDLILLGGKREEKQLGFKIDYVLKILKNSQFLAVIYLNLANNRMRVIICNIVNLKIIQKIKDLHQEVLRKANF